jgi:uncharacterized metal-binding protein YceD (DUF177 family)
MVKQPLLDLIEDEIMLALPVAPRHAACQPPASSADDDDGWDAPLESLAKLGRQRSH